MLAAPPMSRFHCWRGGYQEPGSEYSARAGAGHDATRFDRSDRQHHSDPCALTELALDHEAPAMQLNDSGVGQLIGAVSPRRQRERCPYSSGSVVNISG